MFDLTISDQIAAARGVATVSQLLCLTANGAALGGDSPPNALALELGTLRVECARLAISTRSIIERNRAAFDEAILTRSNEILPSALRTKLSTTLILKSLRDTSSLSGELQLAASGRCAIYGLAIGLGIITGNALMVSAGVFGAGVDCVGALG
jgi:hypothetical protein